MKKYFFLAVLLNAVGLSLLIASKSYSNSKGLLIDDTTYIRVHTSYAEVSIDQQIENADIIVRGEITNISPTLWNQDSGQYWEETVTNEGVEQQRIALAYYTISIQVAEIFLSDRELDDTVKLTVVGMSPLDKNESESSLEMGEQVVILAARSHLTWRNGEQSILMFLSEPRNSLFYQDKNGQYRTGLENEPTNLEDLTSRIKRISLKLVSCDITSHPYHLWGLSDIDRIKRGTRFNVRQSCEICICEFSLFFITNLLETKASSSLQHQP